MTADTHRDIATFRADAARAIADPLLQGALEGATDKFTSGRVSVLADLPDADALRDRLKDIRAATLAKLAAHLETFERQATAAGAVVHWARDAAEANQIVIDIARQYEVKLACKSKSMASEEIHLNDALVAAGITPVETDLGEWIIQLAGETPAHIVGPAIHKTAQQVADLFSKEVGRELSADDIPALTREARRVLRQQFLTAGMGISGANLGVAETGSIVLVTNEGNGRMVTSVPRVHVAIMGVEKIAPTWDDAAVWLALLARSATGQPLSIYTSTVTGPRRADDADGPEAVHIVLLDHGRAPQLGTPYEEALQCIRCGACLNVCPVYKEVGGHTYGAPYSGPIGAVIMPLLYGLEEYSALPHASSLCGACLDVCPARIDLPRMLLQLRQDEVAANLPPRWESALERLVAFGFARPRLYRLGTALGRVFQRPLVRQDKSLNVPGAVDPTQGRKLPALAEKSFMELWKDGEV